MAKDTSWSVHPKPSLLNSNGWAVMSRMSLGGVARIQVPGETATRCEIHLLNGNDEGITLRIDDLARRTSMTLSLIRDRPGEITLDGKGYRVLHPSVHVAPKDPDTSPFAHVIVTPIEPKNSGKSAPNAGATFAPVVERALDTATNRFLSLEDGRLYTMLPESQASVSIGREGTGTLRLKFNQIYNMRLDPAPGKSQWSTNSARQVISDYREAGFGLLPGERFSETEIKPGNLPITFLLPGAGYLQVTELIEGANPLVKLRYKLIQTK
jgi:hypothetical protein